MSCHWFKLQRQNHFLEAKLQRPESAMLGQRAVLQCSVPPAPWQRPSKISLPTVIALLGPGTPTTAGRWDDSNELYQLARISLVAMLCFTHREPMCPTCGRFTVHFMKDSEKCVRNMTCKQAKRAHHRLSIQKHFDRPPTKFYDSEPSRTFKIFLKSA